MGNEPIPQLDDFFVLGARHREASHRERQLEAERGKARERSARYRAEMDRGLSAAHQGRRRKRTRRAERSLPTRPSRRRKVIGWGTALAVIVGAAYLPRYLGGPDYRPLGSAAAASPATPCPDGIYPVGAQYRFEWCARGHPVGWGDCRTLTVAINSVSAPPTWQADIDDALGQLARATGLRLHQEPAGAADITIDWLDPLAFPGHTGTDKAGVTRPEVVSTLAGAGFVSARIDISTHLTGGGGPNGEVPVLLHELGHAVGLGHFDGPETMNPVDQGYPSYQAGDLAGLAALYRPGTCR